MADVAELVAGAACGDGEAWNALVERFGGLIWSIARSQGLSPTDAADVSQTTWLRFAEHLDGLRDANRAAAWLATTARREAVRVSRMGTRQILVDPWAELDSGDGSPDLDTPMIEQERDLLIRRALALLPGRCRDLITRLVSDPAPSYAEISLALDMPIGSIGPTRARCLEHLRRLMSEVETEGVLHAGVAEGSPR